MSSVVASIIQNGLFGTRNSLLGTGVMAPEQNNQVRLLVSAGQIKNALTKLDSVFSLKNADDVAHLCNGVVASEKICAKSSGILHNITNYIKRAPKKIINLFNTVAENDKLFGKLSKAVDFASKNVNNLIVVSSGVKVLTAKDKQSECISQAGNLIGMFAVEGWMKKNLSKYVAKLPINSKMKPVVEGIMFVLGSITGSTICYNIAKKAAAKLKACNEEYKAQEQQNNLPKSVAIKA